MKLKIEFYFWPFNFFVLNLGIQKKIVHEYEASEKVPYVCLCVVTKFVH